MVSCSLGTDHIGHRSSRPSTGSGCTCNVHAHCRAFPQDQRSHPRPHCTHTLCPCGWRDSDTRHIGRGQSLHRGCPRVAHSWHRHTRTGAQSSVRCSCSVHTDIVPSHCRGALSHWGPGTQIPDLGRTAQTQSTHRVDPGGLGHSCTSRIVGARGHCSGALGAGCHGSCNRTVCATPQSAPLRSQELGTSENGALGGSG